MNESGRVVRYSGTGCPEKGQIVRRSRPSRSLWRGHYRCGDELWKNFSDLGLHRMTFDDVGLVGGTNGKAEPVEAVAGCYSL